MRTMLDTPLVRGERGGFAEGDGGFAEEEGARVDMAVGRVKEK